MVLKSIFKIHTLTPGFFELVGLEDILADRRGDVRADLTRPCFGGWGIWDRR